MHLLEPREHPSQMMKWLSPIIALLAMLVVGSLLFLALGVDPLNALYIFFIEPLTSIYSLSELAIKASPLILIALGLAIGFRAKLFNIGAEGQLTMGAIFWWRNRNFISRTNGVVDFAAHGADGGNWWGIVGAHSGITQNAL